MSSRLQTGGSAPGWCYHHGEWQAVVGPDLAVVLPPERAGLAGRLWPLVAAGAEVEQVVDVLLEGGLAELEAFALIAHVQSAVTVITRGAISVTLASGTTETTIDGRGVRTWREHRADGVYAVLIDPGAEEASSPGAAQSSGFEGRFAVGVVPVAALRRELSADECSAPAPPASSRTAGPVQLDDHTQVGPPTAPLAAVLGSGDLPAPVPPVARLLISSGHEVEVDRTVIVGRAPEPGRHPAGEPPRLVAVPSPQHEISASHLEIRPGTAADLGTAVATDLGSTNGTLLRQPGLPPQELVAGLGVALLPGAILDLGEGLTIRVVNPASR